MIIVKASMNIIAGKKDALVKAAQTCVAATVKETGCVSYELFLSPDGTKAVIFEEWADQAALDAHVKTPHFGAFIAATQGLLDGEVAAALYDGKKL